MKRICNALALALLCLGSASFAQKLYVYPQQPSAPLGSVQTVSAIVNGVNDKTVTWSANGGELVGTNPCIVNEPCTIGLRASAAGTYTLTATSNADPSLTASSTITITASPAPVATHPRLGGITLAMLPELRAKAVASNPLYMALYNRAVLAYTADNAIWSWSCKGGNGQPNSDQTESSREGNAELFAFMSLIDPNDATYKWGCYGRDLWMYYAAFWANPLSSAYSPATLSARTVDANYGLTGNHGADGSEPMTLTADWLMGSGSLSAADQAATRAYFALAAKQMITIPLTGARATVGGYNSSAQFTGSSADYGIQRNMGNNYTFSKLLYLTAAALTFNDTSADDPALANTCKATRYEVCPDGTAGSLHAYWSYLTGGMLYKEWAHLEDPDVSWQAYQDVYANLPSQPFCNDTATLTTTVPTVPCFGDGRDGESSEGNWYQYSMARMQLALLSISTAGYDDPLKYGPQLSLATSSWWDLKSVSDLETLTYQYATPLAAYAFMSSGDTTYLFREPSDFGAQAWLLVGDTEAGRTDRTSLLEWPLIATSVGGISDLYYDLSNDYGSSIAIPLFTALPASNPASTPPADPRGNLPLDLYSANNQHILVRNSWVKDGPLSPGFKGSSQQTVFSAECQNSRIDHEHETCGSFDVLSNGEYITKQHTVFNNYNMMLATAEYSNLAGYEANPAQTACLATKNCFEWQSAQGQDGTGGGQFWHGYQGSMVTLRHAELPDHVGFDVDTSGLYNGSAAPTLAWGAINGVSNASRSLLFLRGSDEVVAYDRIATEGNWRKRVWFTTTGPLTVAANTASWPTRSGQQKAYVTSLLPAGAVLSDAGAYATGTTDWEPSTTLQIDAGTPASTQFLTVLGWTGSTAIQSPTSLVQSTAGQGTDCALIGPTLACFLRSWPATFSTVTVPASGATTIYLSDLTPDTTYTISGAGAPSSATTDSAGILTFEAAGSGSLTIGGSGSPPNDDGTGNGSGTSVGPGSGSGTGTGTGTTTPPACPVTTVTWQLVQQLIQQLVTAAATTP